MCAGVGLHVGVLGTEQLAGAVNSDLFHLVHVLAAAVVAVAGVAFGVSDVLTFEASLIPSICSAFFGCCTRTRRCLSGESGYDMGKILVDH